MSLIAFEPRLPDLGSARDRALAAAFAFGYRALRLARRRRLEVALVGGLVGVLLAASAFFALDEAPVAEPVKPAPVGYWMDVPKPFAMFAFASQEFAPAPATYAMRRHTTGGGREDVLTFGNFAGESAWLRLTIHRVGEEGAPDQSLFVETARRAGEAGLALDNLSNPAALPTRFGVAEWADARLAPADGARRENCAAFRFSETKAALRVSGLACGPARQPWSRSQLSCLVGRLDLAAAGGDDELQKFFARSELARDAACPPTRARNSGPAAPARAKPAPRHAAR